jgi:hypothetical protein
MEGKLCLLDINKVPTKLVSYKGPANCEALQGSFVTRSDQ